MSEALARRGSVPRVHRIGDRFTVYVGGRRMISETAAPFSKERLEGMRRGRPLVQRRLGGALLARDLLSEPLANLMGGVFRPLIPSRRFGTWFVVAAGSAWALGAMSRWAYPRTSDPGLLEGTLLNVSVMALVLLWHELGHMAAARRCGIRVDSLGLGTYFILPALFTRISMLALLGRRERIVVMLSGVFFQCLLGIVAAALHLVVHDSGLVRLLEVNLMVALLNLLPFIRLDGHHVAAELVGLLDDQGRLPGVGALYRRATFLANVGFCAYLLWTWHRLWRRLGEDAAASDLIYFAFVTTVCCGVTYGFFKSGLALIGGTSRSVSGIQGAEGVPTSPLTTRTDPRR